jgi:hypothetical protein
VVGEDEEGLTVWTTEDEMQRTLWRTSTYLRESERWYKIPQELSRAQFTVFVNQKVTDEHATIRDFISNLAPAVLGGTDWGPGGLSSPPSRMRLRSTSQRAYSLIRANSNQSTRQILVLA